MSPQPEPVQLKLSILGGPHPTEFTVAQWPPGVMWPAGLPELKVLAGGDFFSLTHSADEWSLVCETRFVAPGPELNPAPGWVAFKLHGPFDFSLTGILSAVLNPLRDAGVGIFALSTFDTDYVLVKAEQLRAARDALRAAGHTLTD